ncbi:microtubule-associated protein futsch-like isoform X3 [Lineus longissimus]|uniref:microtubule-associated protein futsch-like isoform X3 n=1 Tax=Lineus longissimus TaxID=88925 RepID=UPI00315C8A71
MAQKFEDIKASSNKSFLDEELDFYTDLALNETQRWIEGVTRKKFRHPDDIRRTLEDGMLLCELLDTLQPGSVDKAAYNRSSPKDGVCTFLEVCSKQFGLLDWQLFQTSDLDDLNKRKDIDKSEIELETEKRLRNVAVTAYWLGKSVEEFYNGPQLDYTAFTGLVRHHQNHILCSSPKERNNEHRNGLNDSLISDLSFTESDVFESEKLNSADYSGDIQNCDSEDYSRNFETIQNNINMPARYNDQRHHSAESFRNSGTFDHLCSDRAEDSDGSLPGHLNPLSSHDNIHHARSGSTDSLDTPSIGSHSRQSSGSIDSMNTVTSSASGTTPYRKTSSTVAPANPSHNPMQFVQHGRSNLSMEAAAKQRQLDQVKEIKKKQQHEGEDWQDNLSSWRSKRLTKSSSYHRSGLDDDDDDEGTGRPVKTYKDIVEERKGRRASLCFYPTDDDELDFDSIRNQRRASLSHHPGSQTGDGSSLLSQQRKGRKTSLNFYPIEDDDFSKLTPAKSESKTTSDITEEEETRSPAYVPPKPGQRKTSFISEPIGEEEIAPWAIEEPDYGPDLPIVKDLKTPRRFHLENMPLTHIEQIDENGTSSVNGEKSPKLDKNFKSDPKHLKKTPKDEPPKDNKKPDNKKPDNKKPDNNKTEPVQFGKGMLKPTPKKDPAGKIPGKDQLKPVKKDNKPAWATKDLKSATKGPKSDSKDTKNSKDIQESKDSKDIKNSKDTKPEAKDSKPIENISNGKKKTEEAPAARKPGRRTAPAAMPSRRHGMMAPPPTNPHLLLDQLDIPDKHKQDFRKPEPPSSSSDESSDSDSEEAKDKVSSRTTTLFNSRNNVGGRRRKISAPVPPVASELNAPRERRSSIGERPDPYFLHPNRHWKADDIDVTITQEPNNPNGFGISIKGGKDQLCPIIVDRIAPGSAASMCNVCEGDEIVYVNDTCAEDQFRGSVMLVINQANKKGHLEMKLRRYENKKKTRVKLSDPGYKRNSLSFEANRALPGVGTGEYAHGIRRKSTGSERLTGGRHLVDIPITESEELNEPVTTPPVGIVAQRRASLQSSVAKKPFEMKDIPQDVDDDDDIFEELIKPEEAAPEPEREPDKPTEPEARKPLLSNRFKKMPSIVDAQEKLRREKASVDLDDYNSEDERLEQEIMDRLEAEAEEEERQTHEMESRHNSILGREDKSRLKQTSPMIQTMEKKRENNCDEQNNVPKYTTSSAMSDSDSTSLPGTPRKSSVTLNMNLKPTFSKQDSFDSPPARKDSWKDYRREESSERSERSDEKPVFKSSGSFELKPAVSDGSKSSFVEDSIDGDIVKPSVEPVSYSEPPKLTLEEPPKPAIPYSTKPAPAPSPKLPKVSPRTSSPRRPHKNYAFLEKFASEDTTDSKTEEYKSPSYLDKYVKEIDQEKEFDNLFNFDTKDDVDSGQKTYSVYDRYMDHSPRSDLSLTSKPKPYGGYVETTKPKPYTGFTSEGSLPSSTTSSTADLSQKEPQNSLYLPKPRPFVPQHGGSGSGSDKNEQDVNKMDYTRPGADDDSAEKFDQDKKVPPLDMSFGSGKDEEKLWEKLEKPKQKKLPWEKSEIRKFGSLDSLKKDSPRSSNNNSILESGAETPPWRAQSPARQEREREESTARWAEAASHTKPQFESPSKLLDSAEQSRYDSFTDPAPMFYDPKIGSVKSSAAPRRDSDSLPSDYSNGDVNKKTNRHFTSSKLEEEKRKREDWRREQERKNQELFAKGQRLREGNSLEEINPQDIEKNDHMHQAIRNTEMRKLQDLKNGSIPEWAITDRPETDEFDYEMEEKARQEAEEWERYRKDKERNRLERDEQDKQRQKDEERRRIAQEAQKRHLEEKQRQQQMEEEHKRKRALERERQQQQEEADRIKREQEMAEWQRQQELELERLQADRERENRRWKDQPRQRPDTLPVQQRHKIQVSAEPRNYSQPPQEEGRMYDPAYLDGHMMSPDRYYGQPPSNGRGPRTPDSRVPEKGHPQEKVVTPKGEFLSASPLIGRRDVRSPKTHKKGPISAHPITKDDIRDRSIPQPKRRDASSPLVPAKNPLGHNQAQSPGSPQFLRRDDVMNINRKSLGRSGDYTPEDSPVVHTAPELLSKERLKDVGAAPRAQPREDWIQPKHKKTTGEPKDVSRGNWLIEEAERRRQAEMNERELHGSPRGSQQGQPYQGQGYSPSQGHPRLMDDRMGGSPFYQAPGDRSQSMPRDLNNSRTMPDMRQPGDPLQKSQQSNNADYYEPQSMTKSQSFPQFGQGPPQDYHDGGHPGYQARYPQHHPAPRQERSDQPSYAPSAQARPAGPAPAKPPRGAPLPGGANTAEPVISVSGKHKCSHCMKELGQGAAMVIESLQLYYHTQCFRCCVCHTRLGTGQAGADVRVRGSRLHCQNCYSNDEVYV